MATVYDLSAGRQSYSVRLLKTTSTSSGWLRAKMTACANASAWNRERLIILVHALGDVRLADAIRQLRRYCARRDHRGADVVGFDFLAQPFGEGPHGVLGGRVAVGVTLWTATDESTRCW